MKTKVILITGATSGIGFAATESLLSEGSVIYALGRDTLKLQDRFGSQYQNQLRCYSIDLHNISEIEALFDFINSRGEKLTGMVHCAGIEETMPLALYSSEKINNIFTVNVFSAIELIRDEVGRHLNFCVS
jgi:short-subunit dehydrogenase